MHRALFLPALLILASCAESEHTPVRATLADGQVLAGQVRTDTLFLDGDLGTLAIPLLDVGEVVPVEGGKLDGSGGYVTVWLRNGSELRGRWADPELAMDLAIGGDQIGVDLPVAELTRFQLQGADVWPGQPVFRVKTLAGDDVLIDPEDTRIAIRNELGTFAPFLSECASIVPGSDGWILTLHTGTVLRGEVQDTAIRFGLAMGPTELEIPIERIVSMQWEDWGWAPEAGQAGPAAVSVPTEAVDGHWEEMEPRDRAARQQTVDQRDGWFSNERLYDAKH